MTKLVTGLVGHLLSDLVVGQQACSMGFPDFRSYPCRLWSCTQKNMQITQYPLVLASLMWSLDL